MSGWVAPPRLLHNVLVSPSLFVYGTLAPGRPNDHVLADVPGTWQPAKVSGTLSPHGWGAALGYPAIRLDGSAAAVEGFLFTSDALVEHWGRLDDFEGDGYERVLTNVHLACGERAEAFIYVHREVTAHSG
jgi:gamma-glutamylcyclotransferase (GGCT)/AIG2-like uncharacterized protein YtfP